MRDFLIPIRLPQVRSAGTEARRYYIMVAAGVPAGHCQCHFFKRALVQVVAKRSLSESKSTAGQASSGTLCTAHRIAYLTRINPPIKSTTKTIASMLKYLSINVLIGGPNL